MKSKLALFLYIVGLSAITYWAYPIINERYFSDSSEDNEAISSEKQKSCENGDACEIEFDNSKQEVEDGNKINETESSTSNDTESANAFLEISRSDCDSECQYFKIEEEKRYCMQSCGLGEASKSTDECDTLNGLDKDYCWKDKAIKETDFSICKKIEDSKIKEVCQNRITEDIIDNQKLEN